MKTLKAALWMELLKVRRAKIFSISIYFFIFIGLMMGMLMFLSLHPEFGSRSAVMQMKTSFLWEASWTAYYELLIQIVLVLTVIGSGVITSWMFGREFSDRTIKDLLALPVSRSRIVISKLIVLFFWSLMLSVVVLAAALLTGLAIGLPGWDSTIFYSFLGSYMLLAVLNTLLITPLAFVASVGRGFILPISFVILLLILTQILFVGLPAMAFGFPWALPALVSGVAGEAIPPPGFISYLLYALTVLLGYFGTLQWWKSADQK